MTLFLDTTSHVSDITSSYHDKHPSNKSEKSLVKGKEMKGSRHDCIDMIYEFKTLHPYFLNNLSMPRGWCCLSK